MDPMAAEPWPTCPVESMMRALSTTDGPGATASASQAASGVSAAAAQASLSSFFRSRAATLPAPLLVHAAQRSRIIRMSGSGLGVEDEDHTLVVVNLQEELKNQGTREFQMKHFDTAAEVYNEALLLGALQRLCFAMTSHHRLGEHWAGSGVRLPHAAGSVAGDVHLLVVSHLPPACGELAMILHSNRAECMLRLNRWTDAIHESGAALCLNPTHTKSQSRHTRGFQGLVLVDDSSQEPDDGVGAHHAHRAREANDILKLVRNTVFLPSILTIESTRQARTLEQTEKQRPFFLGVLQNRSGVRPRGQAETSPVSDPSCSYARWRRALPA